MNPTLSLFAKIIHCYSLQPLLNTFQSLLRLLSQGHEPDPIPIRKNYSRLFVTTIIEHIPIIFEVIFSGTRTRPYPYSQKLFTAIRYNH